MVTIDTVKCDECGTCVGICPSNALTLVETLSVDEMKCISCNRCLRICPFGAVREKS